MEAQAVKFYGYAGKSPAFLEGRAQFVSGKPTSHAATPELLQLLTS
jgi:hypothetical protein